MTVAAGFKVMLRSVSIVLAAWLLVVVAFELERWWMHVVPAVIWGIFIGWLAIKYGDKGTGDATC